MGYISLNEKNKKYVSGYQQPNTRFDWEDSNLMNYLLGELPSLEHLPTKSNSHKSFSALSKFYDSYNFLQTEPSLFVSEVLTQVNAIRNENPYWRGINIAMLEEILHMHKFCLVHGEGGIGKSFFVKEFEQELSLRQVRHLCVYGKHLKSISEIDFEEIHHIGKTEEFVFVFDAINELPSSEQLALIPKLELIKSSRGVRIIVTYRSHSLDKSVLQEYRRIALSYYAFPGVSFESAAEWFQKSPIEDITEYLDVIYSNNPFLLSRLSIILNSGWDKKLNNTSRFTYIYEHYIKDSISLEIWRLTKNVAQFMYENNKKSISTMQLSPLFANWQSYVSEMEQHGFLTHYTVGNVTYYSFLVESLADYLIARTMLDDLKNRTDLDAINIIKDKTSQIYSIAEMVILLLFDKYSPDYDRIKHILIETGLIDEFSPSTLVKIHFPQEHIPAFLKVFDTKIPDNLIEHFAGYINKPFNCTNYLNNYYLSDEKAHVQRLSQTLSQSHFFNDIISRIKSTMYLINKCACSSDRLEEAFFFAVWCTAAGNQELRTLAKKLLFDVIQQDSFFINKCIELFPCINDYYIRDAIVDALSCCQKNRLDITNFFMSLLADPEFTLAGSLRRMCEYLGSPEAYIFKEKNNLYSAENTEISKDFSHLLFAIDLYEKELLPFRYLGDAKNQVANQFLSSEKQTIALFNNTIAQDFSCVRGGACQGNFSFCADVEKKYGTSFSSKFLNNIAFLSSLELTFRHIFSIYGVDLSDRLANSDFGNSMLRKCTAISIDVFWGSLMCNYYSSSFSAFDDGEEGSIGFQVYNPLEYDDHPHLCSPVSVYKPELEEMDNLLLRAVHSPEEKSESWWADLALTKNNTMQLIKPFEYAEQEWVLLAARVYLRSGEKSTKWSEVYNIHCCTCPEETMRGDGKERYLTIELDDYFGNLSDYVETVGRNWLCNRVPTVSYNSPNFEDTALTLPPASIAKALSLSFNYNHICWENNLGEAIILCNNNKASYYRSPVQGSIYIRKDYFDVLAETLSLKYFAYSEKYLEPNGYCDETAIHMEIVSGRIVKEFLNYKNNRITHSEPPKRCIECIHGFYSPYDSSILHDFLLDNPDIMHYYERDLSDENL